MVKFIGFFLIAFVVGYSGALYHNEELKFAYALGVAIGYTFIPWVVALVVKRDPDERFRFYRILFWILIIIQTILIPL
jgi:heme/copper-type cytochrome/quinol oxidase subunit 4